MNCRDTERLLHAERDHALGAADRAALDRHLAQCPACRQQQAALARVAEFVRSAAADVALPDPGEEWRTLRQRMQTAKPAPAARRQLAPIFWIGAPLAAAAALALAFIGGRNWRGDRAATAANGTDVARAEFVEVKDAAASTMVYVDKESGWLVVWAVPDTIAKG